MVLGLGEGEKQTVIGMNLFFSYSAQFHKTGPGWNLGRLIRELT